MATESPRSISAINFRLSAVTESRAAARLNAEGDVPESLQEAARTITSNELNRNIVFIIRVYFNYKRTLYGIAGSLKIKKENKRMESGLCTKVKRKNLFPY